MLYLMFTAIKNKVFQRVFHSKKYAHTRQRQTLSWQEVKTIGFLLDGSDPVQLRLLLNRLYNYTAEGKKIEMIGYVKKLPPFEEEQIKWITKKDLSWAGIPGMKSIKEFIEKDFDIVINTSLVSIRPLEFISAFSNAKLRIGVYAENKTYCYDFMLHMDAHADAFNYLDQVEHYLKLLKH